MSMYPSNNPVSASLRSYPPGPHSGMDPDPDTHVAADSMDGRARTALTLGLISLLFGVLTGIPAIVVGHRALARIDAADGALKGRWAAWTGIVLGVVSIAVTIGVWTYLHQRANG
jgi:hypothetical protein